MKNIYKLLFFIVASFIFIINVDAAPKFEIKLSCPASAETNQNIECSVLAMASGEDMRKLSVHITTNQYISYVSDDIDRSMSITSDYVKIGTIKFKTKNISNKAMVTVSIKATSVNNIALQDKSKNAYITIKSNVNTLNDIKIDGVTIPNFNKNTASYTVNTTKSSVVISATPSSNLASITGTGTKNLACGSNVYTIKVTAENSKYKNYTVGITRTCDKNVYLKGINISSGTLTPEFNKTTTNYKVEVDKTVEKITVTGIPSATTQTIKGNVTDKKLEFGDNKIEITVLSQTGEKQTYTLNIIREDNRDNSVNLSSLSLSSGTIKFDKDTLNYETKVLYNVENIEILALPEKETSKVEITGNKNLKVGENTILVKVIAENEETKTYIIKVTRLNEGETLGTNANIKNIVVKGYKLKFNFDKEDYKLVIDDEDSLDISVEMEDENATYEIIGNKNLKDGSIIKIVTKSSDGTSKTYTIEIVKNNYTIYFIIAGVLLLIAIAIPIFVYFKSVKGKKKILDVNGYELGKGYEEKDYSRKIISNNKAQNIEQPQIAIPNVNYQQMPMSDTNINNMSNQNDFNNGYEQYNENNSETRCPNCGRELLGIPNECPYCRMKLR